MASKRAQRRKECGSKVGHQTEEQAQFALAKLHKTKGWQGAMRAYRCGQCGLFHIGHTPGMNHINPRLRNY